MIVIDMDIPTSCCECPICHPKGKDEPWNYACFQGMMDINLDEWDEKRHPNCPIKCDIEDINAEIKDKMLDKIKTEILNFKEKCNASDYLGCGILEVIDKYKVGNEE